MSGNEVFSWCGVVWCGAPSQSHNRTRKARVRLEDYGNAMRDIIYNINSKVLPRGCNQI